MGGEHPFERRVAQDAVGLFEPDDPVVVAVSGGPDSMALLHALLALGRGPVALRLHVAHLDHGLRGRSSERDAAFVREHALGLGVPAIVEAVRGLSPSDANLEARARDERIRFLFRVAASVGATKIAVGHTRDDQAETVLHRLGRGAGARALASMEMRRGDGLVRPLLRRRRSECEAYLAALGIEARLDESNLDPRFTRNRLRHQVMPGLADGLGVDVVERLAALADDLRVEADLADRWIAGVLEREPGDDLSIDSVVASASAGGRLVHAWLVARGVGPSRSQVEAVVQLARRGSPSAAVDLTGARVERRYEVLTCRRAEDAAASPFARDPVSWRAPGQVDLGSGWRLCAAALDGAPRERPGTGQAVVDASAVEGTLTVRSPRPGDRIRLRAGRKKLSDLLIDRRVPRVERRRLAVVLKGADIIWVPGVAVAASVTPGEETERWMRLRAERVDCRQMGSVVETQAFRVRFG